MQIIYIFLDKKFYEETSGSIPVVYSDAYDSVAYGNIKPDIGSVDPVKYFNSKRES